MSSKILFGYIQLNLDNLNLQRRNLCWNNMEQNYIIILLRVKNKNYRVNIYK